MSLWLWFGFFAVASLASWLILLPRPNNASLDLLEKFLPYIIGVFGVYMIVTGFWPFGLGLLVFFFGARAISKSVNEKRLKKLDAEMRELQKREL